MARVHYRIGVNTHKHTLRRMAASSRVLMLCLFVIAGGSITGGIVMNPRSNTSQSATELSHREHRNWQAGSRSRISIVDAPRWQKIRLNVDTDSVSITPASQSDMADKISADTIGLNDKPVLARPADETVGAGDSSSADTSDQQTVATAATTTSSATVSVTIMTPTLPTVSIPPASNSDLSSPIKKDVAMQLVSSAENSSLDWKAQYAYLEDIGDGRGYTGGIIGFCSGTGDMLEMIQYYTKLRPSNGLSGYVSALQKVNGSASHTGLGAGFETAWKSAATDPLFQQAQNYERDRVYFDPALKQAKADGLRALGQFMYYDALVMHGPGDDPVSFGGIRAAALKKAKTPAQGGTESTYLNAFLDARAAAMKTEAAHDDISRVDTSQRLFLKAGNLDLNTPLSWQTYGDSYKIQ